MPSQNRNASKGRPTRPIDRVIVVINSVAIGLVSIAAVLLIFAMIRENADFGHRIIADLSRGDVITIGIPR